MSLTVQLETSEEKFRSTYLRIHHTPSKALCESQVGPMRLSPKHVWIGELMPAGSSFREIPDLMQKLSHCIRLLQEEISVHSVLYPQQPSLINKNPPRLFCSPTMYSSKLFSPKITNVEVLSKNQILMVQEIPQIFVDASYVSLYSHDTKISGITNDHLKPLREPCLRFLPPHDLSLILSPDNTFLVASPILNSQFCRNFLHCLARGS